MAPNLQVGRTHPRLASGASLSYHRGTGPSPRREAATGTGDEEKTVAIEVRGLSKKYGSFQAVNDVSFEVQAGQLVALLGPSGSGKSTILRTIAGLESADSGSVMLTGEDATALPVQQRGVGFVFQHYALFRHMTVRENIGFGLKIRKVPKPEIRRRVDELLDLIQLGGYANRFPSQLSGGQRQRVALARALAPTPKVLLLDEPFGALDAKVRDELRTWLRRLHDEVHVTSLFVTHDQREAFEVSDQIVVLADGQVQQIGPPRPSTNGPPTRSSPASSAPSTSSPSARSRPDRSAGARRAGSTAPPPTTPRPTSAPTTSTSSPSATASPTGPPPSNGSPPWGASSGWTSASPPTTPSRSNSLATAPWASASNTATRSTSPPDT
ncbi:Sulfate/thiosulfate import ATP-binding protein CysA [Planctomyces sp. SH-PL62]|nr:Sulfate/thiosulfate import ATP-binding protein CysA [Planctomyces sp. SH-PL62]